MTVPAEILSASILVVDDREIDLRLVRDMLEGSGFRNVTTTRDPMAVGGMHALNRYDLIIVDMLMPRMDGFAVIEGLKRSQPDGFLSLLAVTADPSLMARALEAGARDYINKPIRMTELVSRVRNLLEVSLLMGEKRRNLLEAQTRFRAIVEQSLVGIYVIEDGRFNYANPRMCEILGYTPEELTGLPAVPGFVVEDGASTGVLRFGRRDGSVAHIALDGRTMVEGGRRVTLGIAQDVTDRVIAAENLRESEERHRQRVLEIQEAERRAISLELHDDVGQSLIALKIGLHRLGLGLDPSQAKLHAECMAVADAAREKVREVATHLHPPQLAELGLHDALRGLVHRHREITGLTIRFSSALGARRLPESLEGACYRICQEALNNATLHAKAQVIDVELQADERELSLEIRDDGVGFDEHRERTAASAGTLGLMGMKERARLAGGSLEIRTAPGAGTRVSVKFPA